MYNKVDGADVHCGLYILLPNVHQLCLRNCIMFDKPIIYMGVRT